MATTEQRHVHVRKQLELSTLPQLIVEPEIVKLETYYSKVEMSEFKDNCDS